MERHNSHIMNNISGTYVQHNVTVMAFHILHVLNGFTVVCIEGQSVNGEYLSVKIEKLLSVFEHEIHIDSSHLTSKASKTFLVQYM